MLNQIFLNLLNFFVTFLGNNYGAAIIALTLVIRFLLLPIILPSIRAQKKQLELQPKLNELKKLHGHDKELLAKKQMEFYKENKINPLSGCLPQIVQLVLFIAFYQVLVSSLNNTSIDPQSMSFFWLKLNQPDHTFILPVLAAASQLLLGVMLLPATSTLAEHKLASQTKNKKDDKAADDMTNMAQTMQSQMVFIMPFVTLMIALRFPSGLALYWVVSTFFSVLQQYYVSGLGGLKPYLARFGILRS